MLNAYLVANLLTPAPNDYWISALRNGSVGLKELAQFVIDDGCEINIATLIDAVTRLNAKTAELVASGVNVDNGLVYLRANVKGAAYDQTWNAETNPVQIVTTPGTLLRKVAAATTVRILGVKSDSMAIVSVTDLYTQFTDGSLTRGRNAEIRGTNIKIAGEHPDVGLSLRHIPTGAVTRMDTADIVLNEPSRLLLLLPAHLADGEYELTVTTQYNVSSKLLKTPHSATLPYPVIIA
jgi:hypothetical protein